MVLIHSMIRLAIVQAALLLVHAKASQSSDASWYYDHWCGGSHEYLDDSKCAKIFPVKLDREWTCAVPSSTAPLADSGFQADTILADVTVNTSELSSVVNDADVNLCIILTRRVANASASQGVTIYNKYLCAGDYSATVAYETWSSSKVFAMANAAGHLRTNESSCGSGDAHNHQFGLDGTVTGKHGVTQLGDLATVICSYDTTAGYSSNSLSSYFHDIGWRGRINGLVQDWLLVGQNNTVSTTSDQHSEGKNSTKVRDDALPQTLGGNYGEATPTDLSLDVTSPSATSSPTCGADKDPWPVKFDNSLAALSAAELVRRLALHRELPKTLRFPGAEWTDVQTILYGAQSSTLFPGQAWGGMTADTAIYTQAGLDLGNLLAEWDQGNASQWRIFSKLGAGYSSSRSRGEIVSNAYACLPRFANGGVVGGIELTIAARASVPGDSSLNGAEAKLHSAMDRALQHVLANYAV